MFLFSFVLRPFQRGAPADVRLGPGTKRLEKVQRSDSLGHHFVRCRAWSVRRPAGKGEGILAGDIV